MSDGRGGEFSITARGPSPWITLVSAGAGAAPSAAPDALLADALLRLDALRAALQARDVRMAASLAALLSGRFEQHGAARLAELFRSIGQAATLGCLDGVRPLLAQAERELAHLELDAAPR